MWVASTGLPCKGEMTQKCRDEVRLRVGLGVRGEVAGYVR